MSFDPRLNLSPALKDKLARLNLRTGWDLILHLPLRYEDQTHLTAIRDARPGDTVQVEGVVIDQQVQQRPRKQMVCRLEDASGALQLRYLNFYPNQVQQLSPGQRVRCYGEIRLGFFGAEMVHPKIRPVSDHLPSSLTPIYPVTAGLPQPALLRAIQKALRLDPLQDTLPDAVQTALGLWPLRDALLYLHEPPPDAALAALDERTHPAWRRLQFDELLAQQLSLQEARRKRREQQAPRLTGSGQWVQALLAALPFQLTPAQQRVVDEISRDLATPHPMHRLLQGDVGAGKTIVAALAALQAIESGYQVALMAPTEILAEQHYLKFRQWLEPLGLRVGWLSGSRKKRERQAVCDALAQQEIPLVVGTHALFQDDVHFQRLGLVIVDEQHRFGVGQRLALRSKGQHPHLLMMSATPIPRTLSMSYFADLDVSSIDQLPPGRTPIATRLIAASRRQELMARLRNYCQEGRQVYWVCPLIEESETLELQTAIDTHAELAATLPEFRVGLVHGRLPASEKAHTMAAFAAHELDILCATTVIEVGVDVPNASLMVIEHAERFGLAQLHQLRGRVGRGSAESHCLLLYETPLSEQARERLAILHDTTDGFKIAEADLKLRGPGEFMGSRQSGAPLMRFANPEEQADLLAQAQQLADEWLNRDPERARQHSLRWHGGRMEWLKA